MKLIIIFPRHVKKDGRQNDIINNDIIASLEKSKLCEFRLRQQCVCVGGGYMFCVMFIG